MYLSVCLPAVCLSVCMSICLTIYLSIYLSIYLERERLTCRHPSSAASIADTYHQATTHVCHDLVFFYPVITAEFYILLPNFHLIYKNGQQPILIV